MPANFERLPNEIILEIFKYVRVKDVFNAFYPLNHRIQAICRILPLRIELPCNATNDLSLTQTFATQVTHR